MRYISLETEEIETDYDDEAERRKFDANKYVEDRERELAEADIQRRRNKEIINAILKEDGYDPNALISHEPGDLADQLQRERARSEALQKDRDDWKSKYDALASVDSHGKLYQAGLIDQSRYTQLANQTQAQLNAQYAEFRRDLNSYWGQALGSQFYRKE